MLLVVMTINQYVYVIDFIDSIDEESKNCSDLMKEHCNLIRDVTFAGCWRLGRGIKRPPSLKCFIHIRQWWNLAVIPYLKKTQKYMNNVTYILSSANISIFSPEISKFCFIPKYRYRLHFDNWLFLILLAFSEAIWIDLKIMGTILTMSTKIATLGLLKIKVFWNKCHYVIIFVYDFNNKILPRDSNYIVDLVMWSKLGNSSISMRQVMIPQFYKDSTRKTFLKLIIWDWD